MVAGPPSLRGNGPRRLITNRIHFITESLRTTWLNHDIPFMCIHMANRCDCVVTKTKNTKETKNQNYNGRRSVELLQQKLQENESLQLAKKLTSVSLQP